MLGAIVLAGGESKRFKSAKPKVLHDACGRLLIGWSLDALANLPQALRPSKVVIVEPPGVTISAQLQRWSSSFEIVSAIQRKPLGTGDAAKVGLAALKKCEEVVVLAGDAPLIETGSVAKLIKRRRSASAGASMLIAQLQDPTSYGRVILDTSRRATSIVEHRNATPEQREIREVNASVYAFDSHALRRALARTKRDKKSGEYYLTDAVELLGGAVVVTGSSEEVLGTNTRIEFATVLEILRLRIVHKLMDNGVTVIDPASVWVDVDCVVGRDTIVHPGTRLYGQTTIGASSEIGPDVSIFDSSIGRNTTISYSVVRGAQIGNGCDVGPFASLRQGTVLQNNSKAGTFVETKNARIGTGSKVPHLSYMGDVEIGKDANVGAGSITCNYDGASKHETHIGDEAFIGSDTMFVAPVKLGKGARTAAGAVVTKDVVEGDLVGGVPARRLTTGYKSPTRRKGPKSPKRKNTK